MDELIRNATIEDFKRSYIWNSKKAQFICLICGENVGDKDNDINIHASKHGTPIERLLLLEKKYTGLTEIQKEFLTMAANKYSDKEIASRLAWADSTVRNMRFALRERARQARAFLAVMELVEEDYKYLSRTKDGSKYYKKCGENIMSSTNRKELINNYKQQEIEMGIIQVYNTVTGYSFVDTCMNLYKPFEAMKFQFNLGKFKVKKLQEDWNTYGESTFEFKVVENLKPNEGATDKEKLDDLKELLKIWVDSQGESLKLYNKI